MRAEAAPATWWIQYVQESRAIRAQASAVQTAKAAVAESAARLRPVSQSSGTKSSTVGWSAAPSPMSAPEPRSSRTAKHPSRTSSTGMMLVWPRWKALRTGSESISRLIATGAAISDVRRETSPGSARAATTPRRTTSSSDPKVQTTPRLCSAERVSGFSTRPANGVPVNFPVA